jgi:hypothetical protein
MGGWKDYNPQELGISNFFGFPVPQVFQEPLRKNGRFHVIIFE